MRILRRSGGTEAHDGRPEWGAALVSGVIAIAALVVGSGFGKIHSAKDEPRIVLWSAVVVLLVSGVVATRRIASVLGWVVSSRALPAAGAVVRLVATGIGYIVLLCAELGIMEVSIEHLLVGAGLAGVVLGIAAQQSLANVFASIVLLLAQPFVVGDRIRIRSGALGGVFDAQVLSISLTYVTVRTVDGVIRIPNSVMLASAVGHIDTPPLEVSDAVGP